jgi:pimeloyl-[acyl-carrier protein] methyl ester esterase
MIELVVLPGLDGTATLLSEFKSASMASFSSVTTVSYPPDKALNYAELELIARSALPKDKPFVLLGESFSGPIALSIAANPPPGLVGLVLSATFANNPVALLKPFASLTRFAPIRAFPVSVLSWFLLGSWVTPELKAALQEALYSVAPSVLRTRAAESLRADVTSSLSSISVPVLYLRAAHDRLILPGSGDRILLAIPHAKHINIPGPHLLLQAAPVLCAKAVSDFAKGLS